MKCPPIRIKTGSRSKTVRPDIVKNELFCVLFIVNNSRIRLVITIKLNPKADREFESALLNAKETHNASGFTLIELMIAVAIAGILSGIAVMNLISYLDRARIAHATGEIKSIEKIIYNFEMSFGCWPADLSEAGADDYKDPWGKSYRYVPVQGTPKGKLRKDRFLVPINSDFDLYSMGPDGKSQMPLTAKASRDDIIRANNGGYIGVAQYY